MPSIVFSGIAYWSSPTDTIKARLTDTVNGNRTVKRVPLPGIDMIVMLPPSCLTALCTTSMPTPRPEICVTDFAVLKPGRQDELQHFVVAQSCVGRHQAAFDRFRANGLDVDAGAVVGNFDDDVARFARQPQIDATDVRFAEAAAEFGAFDAVVDRVAQHVFERRHHTFEHVAVEFAFRVVRVEIDFFAELARDLPNGATQPRQQPVERHHARAHQPFLQLGVHARLLDQQRFGFARFERERFFQVEHVRRAFRQRSRQLLQLRIAIHLERIELFVVLTLVDLVTEQHLRFGFDLETTQLFADALDRDLHFFERRAEVVHALLDARADDAAFAGEVDELFEQAGRHAHHLARFLRQPRPRARSSSRSVSASTASSGR